MYVFNKTVRHFRHVEKRVEKPQHPRQLQSKKIKTTTTTTTQIASQCTYTRIYFVSEGPSLTCRAEGTSTPRQRNTVTTENGFVAILSREYGVHCSLDLCNVLK